VRSMIALLQCGTDAFVCQPVGSMVDYFSVLSISISRLSTSVRSSGRPIPFCSALREKYFQTLRSMEVGKKTFAPEGMWCNPRTPLLKSISAGISSPTDRSFIRFICNIAANFKRIRGAAASTGFVGQIVNLRRIVNPPAGFRAPLRVRQTLALSVYIGQECQIPNNSLGVTSAGGLTIRRRLTTCPTNAQVSFNVESPVPCYGLSIQFHDTNFASSLRGAGIGVKTYAGGKLTLGSEGDST
jgi:hypothetical protein